MIKEREYAARVEALHRKKYAQFFTPEQIADFMAEWVLGNVHDGADILEPAFGLGVFSRLMYERNTDIRVVGYDIDERIISCAKANFCTGKYNLELKQENYITSPWNEAYDGIICNPPYLKFHDYDNAVFVPLVNSKLHIRLSGFTNIYTLFLLKSISQLREGGRLAYIVPSEFLNSDYGVEVKRALLESGTLRHIIIVDFTKCAFDDALTTACILFCEKKKGGAEEVRFSNIVDVTELSNSLSEYKTFAYGQLDPNVKWKLYYEKTQAGKYHHLVPFSTFAKVSRGIATGANGFFAFKASKIESSELPRCCFRPCICHAADVKTPFFSVEDFNALSAEDKTVYLFDGCAVKNDPHVEAYIQAGMADGIDKRHLTANRSPWYALENRVPSPIWVSVFNRKGLRFVRNNAGVFNLTTFHCVYNKGRVDTEVLFAYLVTDMAKEIFLDNSRQYGNGLVKFEPNDLNKGRVVDLRMLSDSEKLLVISLSKEMQGDEAAYDRAVCSLDNFFRKKFSNACGLDDCYLGGKSNTTTSAREKQRNSKSVAINQLDFLDIFTETM